MLQKIPIHSDKIRFSLLQSTKERTQECFLSEYEPRTMKPLFILIALFLCFVVLAGCGTEEVISQMLSLPESTQAPADTEVPIWTPPGKGTSPALSPTPVPTPLPSSALTSSPSPVRPTGQTISLGDYSSLTVSDCVEDGWTTPGVIPHISLDCPGAESLNKTISQQFMEDVENPLWTIHYECEIGAHRYLSVLMVKQSAETRYHTAYNLDLSTGEALTGKELLSLLGQDEAALKSIELEVLAEEFTQEYGQMQGQIDQQFYSQQYAKTTSIDNAELDNLWFGPDNELYFIGRIYPLAGAEYYEYPLCTGLVF